MFLPPFILSALLFPTSGDSFECKAVAAFFSGKKVASSLHHNRGDGHAQRMKVIKGWQACRNDSAYRAIFRDMRLVELPETFFGRIIPA